MMQSQPISNVTPTQTYFENIFSLPAAQPPKEELSTTEKVGKAATEIGVSTALNFGMGYLLAKYLPITQLVPLKPVEYGIYLAINSQVMNVTNQAFKKILGCTPDTTWRNITVALTAPTASLLISGYACNLLGIYIDPYIAISRGIEGIKFGLKVGVPCFALWKGVEWLTSEENNELVESVDFIAQEKFANM